MIAVGVPIPPASFSLSCLTGTSEQAKEEIDFAIALSGCPGQRRGGGADPGTEAGHWTPTWAGQYSTAPRKPCHAEQRRAEQEPCRRLDSGRCSGLGDKTENKMVGKVTRELEPVFPI